MFDKKKPKKVRIEPFYSDAEDAEWIENLTIETKSHAVTMRGIVKAARKYIEDHGTGVDDE